MADVPWHMATPAERAATERRATPELTPAQVTAAKLQQVWLETEKERQRLWALQRKTIRRLTFANWMLGFAFFALIWAILVIFRVL